MSRTVTFRTLIGHDALALLAREHQEFEDRRVMDAGDSLDAGHAVSLQQHGEHQFSLLHGNVHAVQGAVTSICEHLTALGALVALAVLALTELPAFDPAIVAGHCEISY